MPDVTPLSEREKEILTLVTSGLTNREIAQQLGISPNTVKVHLSNIFEKIGVASRTEATVYAIEHRIVDVPGGDKTQEEKDKHQKVRWIIIPVLFLLMSTLLFVVLDLFIPPSDNESISTQNPAERWAQLSSLPEQRRDMAAVVYNDNIYVIAGNGKQTVSGTVYKYLTDLDDWEKLKDKPTPVSHIQGAVIGEKIYIPGGNLADGKPTNVLEIYDPRRDVWELGSPLPQAISSYALVAFEGQLYIFGGWDGQAGVASVYIYNPLSDTWRNGTPMQFISYKAGAVVLNDGIVIIGGRNDESPIKTTEVYFPSRDVEGETPWESFVDLPIGLKNLSAANVFGAVYVFGLSSQDIDDNQIGFALMNDQWEKLFGINGFYPEDTELTPLGSSIYILNSLHSNDITELWVYQAYYYEIYLPIIP